MTLRKMVVVTCAVLEAEICHLARDLEHIVAIKILKQGLHNDPSQLRDNLQDTIDLVESEWAPEAIAFGYGLCSRGIEGVHARGSMLIIPRAHDCITLLLGNKDRYARYVKDHPGTYWYSPGWNRHHVPPGKERFTQLYARYCEKYGPDNADFLMETEQHWMQVYDRATYVDIGVGATEADLAYTRACAQWLGWSFDRQQGDPALLRALLTGPWDEERFVVLEPGETVRMVADERIIVPTRPAPRAAEPTS